MIDIEKVVTWVWLLSSVSLVMWASHFMTMSLVRRELAEMVIPMHEPQSIELNLSANPGLDSLAMCHSFMISKGLTVLMEER
jgi:hypothetical protein